MYVSMHASCITNLYYKILLTSLSYCDFLYVLLHLQCKAIPTNIALLLLLNFRDTIQQSDQDPEPTLLNDAKDFLSQKAGPKVTMKHVGALVSKVIKNYYAFIYFCF